MPTEALIAQVIVSKYSEHLPLYRQAQVFARHGVPIERSTLADRAGRAAFHLAHRRCQRPQVAGVGLAPSGVEHRGGGLVHEQLAGALEQLGDARDDRPFGGSDPPGVVFTLHRNRL